MSKVETNVSSAEFERKIPREVERTYLPLFPEEMERFRMDAEPIEQFYLSHPDEPFGLRMREHVRNGHTEYTATIKDRGATTDGGLDRLEIETVIDADTYNYYKSSETPIVRKLRASPFNNVIVDFFEDGRVHAEAENPLSWLAFCDRFSLHDRFVDVTGDKTADSEWRSHLRYRRDHSGIEALKPSEPLDVQEIANNIMHCYRWQPHTIVQISGRSGSGKSTIVQELQSELLSRNIASDAISTDDYHRGATWLRDHNGGADWTEWDDPIVYDTTAMRKDIEILISGTAVPKRGIDFTTAEPVYDGNRAPTPVLIAEGIYTRSADLAGLYDLDYAVPTPMATCIGRRLLRDLKERPQFADPEASLHYMITQAEPTWRAQPNSSARWPA